jgi:hypothetical protein
MSEVHRAEATDLYELLEVSPRASQAVVQAAYRVLVRAAHPDRNPGLEAEQRVRRLNFAYQILGDPERRARYDLEYSRAHRLERLTQPVPGRARTPGLPPRAARAAYPRGTRAPLLTGQAVLGMVLVAAFAIVVLMFVWFGLDGSSPPVTYPEARPELSAP